MQPKNPDEKVWRYKTMPVFVDLIESHKLHFARSDTLEDPFEGSTTKFNKLMSALGELRNAGHPPVDVSKLKEIVERDATINRRLREMMYVSCWCIGEHESIAMWNMYGSAPGSVAIRTTYNKLRNSLCGDVLMGVVQYTDYDHLLSTIPNYDDPVARFTHKRVEYRHESEVRCLLFPGDNSEALGLKIAIDIESVIEVVVVQPSSEPWVKDSMELLIQRHGLKVLVGNSIVDLQPIF